MVKYDIDWLEKMVDRFGFGDCFQEYKLDFLVKYEDITTQIAVVGVIATPSHVSKDGEVSFDSYDTFWGFV